MQELPHRMAVLQHHSTSNERRPQVCVVEDDAAVLDSLRWMLERNGYSVRMFASPAAFLTSGELDRFDCLILELQLPGISGLELLELLRTRAYAKPVVLIASGRYPRLESRMRKAGVDGFLLKPLSPDTLLAALQDLFSREFAAVASLRT